MAVFKCRNWTSAQSSNGWYETEPGDVYHVGLYVGNGNVVEAQSKKTGVVTTKIDKWHYAAELVDTVYDVCESTKTEQTTACLGIVKINSGWLNLRSGPATTRSCEAKAYNGDVLSVVGEHDDWYIVDRGGKSLYASKKYIECPSLNPREYVVTIRVSAASKQALEDYLNEAGYVFDVAESGDAA
jgi:uncharacterized protein YgiM (DUF1202 family)